MNINVQLIMNVFYQFCVLCKNNKYKLLFGNLDAYYAIKYMNIITNSIYYAIDINYKLSSSTQNYKNILIYFINELFFRICENEDE